MILELDAGNTRIKWRALSLDGVVHRNGVCRTGDRGLLSLSSLNEVSRVRVSSVADEQVDTVIKQLASDTWGIVAEFAKSVSSLAGVKNGYEKPERLGIDRWLSMVSAYHGITSAVCVVDCGSSLTIDFVDAEGCHLGGYILPGLSALRASLLEKTAKVLWDPAQCRPSLTPGVNTEEAVEHGLLMMLVGAVNQALTEAAIDCTVCLTGGDAELLLPWLPKSSQHKPDLVLDGLALALP